VLCRGIFRDYLCSVSLEGARRDSHGHLRFGLDVIGRKQFRWHLRTKIYVMEQIFIQTDIQCSQSTVWAMLKNTHEWTSMAPETFSRAPVLLGSGHLQISTKVTGSNRVLEIRVFAGGEQTVSWEAIGGTSAGGSVQTQALGPLLTRVSIAMHYHREGIMEAMYAKTQTVERCLAQDLARIKRLLERQQSGQRA
jgi:hypothetical protein